MKVTNELMQKINEGLRREYAEKYKVIDEKREADSKGYRERVKAELSKLSPETVLYLRNRYSGYSRNSSDECALLRAVDEYSLPASNYPEYDQYSNEKNNKYTSIILELQYTKSFDDIKEILAKYGISL